MEVTFKMPEHITPMAYLPSSRVHSRLQSSMAGFRPSCPSMYTSVCSCCRDQRPLPADSATETAHRSTAGPWRDAETPVGSSPAISIGTKRPNTYLYPFCSKHFKASHLGVDGHKMLFRIVWMLWLTNQMFLIAWYRVEVLNSAFAK